jgi:predicted acetyltransferase
MKIELTTVQRDEKEILRNLMEKYDYELSQYGGDDVNKLGLYGFDYLDNYWQEDAKRHAFFIKVDRKLAGFAMIISDYFYLDDKNTDFVMSDFFVMYKYRNSGVGKYAAKYIFDMFRGTWQLNTIEKNIVSVNFWKKVIGDYTGGKYEVLPNEKLGAGHNVFLFTAPKQTISGKDFNRQDIEIRLAVASDAPELHRLNELINDEETNSVAGVDESLKNNKQEFVYVASHGDKLVGFCCGHIKPSFCYSCNPGEITELVVMEGYRRRGIGKRLMIHIENEFKQRGVTHMHLLTGDGNKVAQMFYLSCGYTDKSRMMLEKDLRRSDVANPARLCNRGSDSMTRLETEQPIANDDFWQALDKLVSDSEIVIDRPKGSAHPRYPEFIYPLEYGYLKGTTAMDG